MATDVVFEVSTLADVIRKAASVAPSKAGNAFDKAAGIILDVTPDEEVKCVVRATNLDVFYMEVVDVHSATGGAVRWRLPSALIDSALKSITPTPGKTLTMTDAKSDNRVHIACGRLKASMGVIDSEFYQDFPADEPDIMKTVSGVAGRIEQVAWAVAKPGNEPLNGIHFTGEYIVATDRYRIARVPLVTGLDRPVTVPVGVLASVLKQTGEVDVGITENLMVFRPDDYTQISSAILAYDYPNLERIMRTEYPDTLKVNKNDVAAKISSSLAFCGSTRDPIVQLIIGKGEMAVLMTDDEASLLGDVIEIPGFADHARTSFFFTPQYLTDSLARSPNDIVEIGYDREETTRTPVYINGGSGYEAWLAPRKKNT